MLFELWFYVLALGIPTLTYVSSLWPPILTAQAQQALEVNKMEVDPAKGCLHQLSSFRHEQQES